MAGSRVRATRGIHGFTLIELMVVVAIVAILIGIALPSYRNNIIRSNRVVAQGDLMGYAQAMEKEYSLNFTYATASATAGTVFPGQSPLEGSVKKYNLTLDPNDPSASSYIIQATPIGGSTQAADGALRINHLGQRWWDKNNDGDFDDPGEDSWDAH